MRTLGYIGLNAALIGLGIFFVLAGFALVIHVAS